MDLNSGKEITINQYFNVPTVIPGVGTSQDELGKLKDVRIEEKELHGMDGDLWQPFGQDASVTLTHNSNEETLEVSFSFLEFVQEGNQTFVKSTGYRLKNTPHNWLNELCLTVKDNTTLVIRTNVADANDKTVLDFINEDSITSVQLSNVLVEEINTTQKVVELEVKLKKAVSA